jgi:hypothetical protein
VAIHNLDYSDAAKENKIQTRISWQPDLLKAMKYEVLCKAALLMDLATNSALICKVPSNIIQTNCPSDSGKFFSTLSNAGSSRVGLAGFAWFSPGVLGATVDLILFYNGRNSPESPQAHDPTLGGYIIQIKITFGMKVPCRCKHAARHLGANALKTRITINSNLALGGYSH